jgi:hypothetical protein
MGRSVNYLNNAEYINYIDTSSIEENWEWNDFVEEITNLIQNKYKSFSECNKWQGNETKIILENNLVNVGISEYCGLTSISIAPRQFRCYEKDNTALAINWINKVSNNMSEMLQKYFDCYRKIGTFSNGESVLEKIN